MIVWMAAACMGAPVVRDHSEHVTRDLPLSVQTATGEELARYQAAALYSEDNGGKALVVIKGDEVVFERYAKGVDPEQSRHLFSGTKTFGCLAVMTAVSRGELSLDGRLAELSPKKLTDGRQNVTVRHALSLATGLHEDRMQALDSMTEQRVADQYAQAMRTKLDAQPGKRFIYGRSGLTVLAAYMQMKFGRDYVAYLGEHVFEPLSFEANWMRDKKGNPELGFGSWTTATEWAKIGLLLRDDGQYLGKQVVEPGYLSQCFEPSDVNPSYGLTLWLNTQDISPVAGVEAKHRKRLVLGTPDLVAAAGYGGQRLYVSKQEDLVVVRQADVDRGFQDAVLLGKLLGSENQASRNAGVRRCSTSPTSTGWWGLVSLLVLFRQRSSR